jgi:hypothetical protein
VIERSSRAACKADDGLITTCLNLHKLHRALSPLSLPLPPRPPSLTLRDTNAATTTKPTKVRSDQSRSDQSKGDRAEQRRRSPKAPSEFQAARHSPVGPSPPESDSSSIGLPTLSTPAPPLASIDMRP